MKKKTELLTSFEDFKTEKYGPPGTLLRDLMDMESEAFILGVKISQMRKDSGMTQQQLADKCGTTKSYISRIENDASDIRLSTLMRIFRQGFGKTLKLEVV